MAALVVSFPFRNPTLRRRRPVPRLLTVLLGMALLAALAGQAGAQRLPTRIYTEQDGLRSSTVYSLAQDHEGRMWFATRAGAVVFDGFEWSQPPSVPVPPFQDYEILESDGVGGAWVASVDVHRPVLRLDARGEVSDQLPAPLADRVAPEGRGVTGVVAGDPDQPPILAVGTWQEGLRLWDGARWSSAVDAAGRRRFPVYALESAGGRVFVGTDRGVAELGNGRLDDDWSDLLPDGSREVRALSWESLDGRETLWVVGRDWVGRIERGTFHMMARSVRISFDPTRHLLVAEADGRGGLFFGSELQLLHLSADGSLSVVGRSNGLAADGATDLLLDREGSVWISSPRGVSRIKTLRFSIYDASQGLLEDEVASILEPRPGELVFGHNSGITVLRDGEVVTTHRLDRPAIRNQLGRVLDLALDHHANLWAATGALGLARIAPDGTVTWFSGGERREDRVDVVWADEHGRVIAGTGRGLARPEGDRLVPLDTPGLGEIASRKLESGPDGTLYLATPGHGLYVRRDTRWVQARMSGEVEGESYLFTVHPARSGRVWVGSLVGLRVFEDGELRRPADEALRIDRPVYLLIEDPEGTLWIGTDFGIYRWDGSTLDHFTGRDGLPGNEANRDAALVDSAGRLWIGTDRGVSRITDRRAQRLRAPPVVELAAVEVDGKTVPPDEALELGYRRDGLSFRVRAVSYLDDGNIVYRTRLEGHGGRWILHEGHGRMESRYSALAPGTYTFMVQARSSRSPWSPVATAAPITIDRPFWRQAWFLAACALLLVAVGVGGHRVRSQHRYAHELERQVAARTEELATSRSFVEAERERLARTLESVADGLAATDGDGRVLLWNRAAEEMTGIGAEEAANRPLREVLPLIRERDPTAGSDSETQPIDIARTILERDARPLAPETYGFVDRFRRQRTIELTGAPTGAATRRRGVVVAFRDVTERRRLEEELVRAQKLESLGVLAGGIAHDFNNLLTVILGYVSLVQASHRVEAPEREDLEQATKAVARAQELSQRLLTFSHGGTPVTGAVTVADVLFESADFTCRGSNVRCSLDLPEDLWPAEADEGQVSQVLNNLLINAIQAMPEGGTVAITAGNERLESDEVPGLAAGRYVHVSISDHGPGIPPDVLPHIFDPFFSTKDTGSGIGLTTVYSILRKHRGAVTVDSTPGRGTRFDLYLPASAHVAGAPRRTGPVPVPGTGSGRILVMDDQPTVRGVLENLLRRLGYAAVGTADGDEAVERYREALDEGEPFDAVILDLTVPGGKGGQEALRDLLRIDPGVLAVASSGYVDDPALSLGAPGGFVDALPKPYRIADVAELLHRVLSASGGAGARAGSVSPP